MQKLFFRYLCFALLLLSSSLTAQTVDVEKLEEAVFSNSDRTYLNFGQGFGNYKTPYGIRPLNPILFEGQISPDFTFNLSEKRAMGLTVFPKIIVRMYHRPSLPVGTPSYVPSLLFYHQLNWPFTKRIFRFVRSEEQSAFLTYRAIHHSNGQEGTHYIAGTDSVNYLGGNFATNALEIAFSWSAIASGTVGKVFANGRLAYERQLDLDREASIKNSYYYNKASLESRFIYSEKIKAYVTYSFMWGTKQFRPRNSVDIFLAYKPFKRMRNFSVFMRGYIGPDYYNLYYENMLRSLTVGIIADPLRIPVIKKMKNKE